jgi:hypothetical protein
LENLSRPGSIIFFGKSEQTRKHNLLWKIRTDQEAELSLENLSGTGSIIFGKSEHLPAGSSICGKIGADLQEGVSLSWIDSL